MSIILMILAVVLIFLVAKYTRLHMTDNDPVLSKYIKILRQWTDLAKR
jgi:uncharacterized protein YneF (UPF0154 family)